MSIKLVDFVPKIVLKFEINLKGKMVNIRK